MITRKHTQNVNSAVFLTVRTVRTYLIIRRARMTQMIRRTNQFRIDSNRNETNATVNLVGTYLIIATASVIRSIVLRTTQAVQNTHPFLRIRGRRGRSRRLSLGLLGLFLLINRRSGSGASNSRSGFLRSISRHCTYCDVVDLLWLNATSNSRDKSDCIRHTCLEFRHVGQPAGRNSHTWVEHVGVNL